MIKLVFSHHAKCVKLRCAKKMQRPYHSLLVEFKFKLCMQSCLEKVDKFVLNMVYLIKIIQSLEDDLDKVNKSLAVFTYHLLFQLFNSPIYILCMYISLYETPTLVHLFIECHHIVMYNWTLPLFLNACTVYIWVPLLIVLMLCVHEQYQGNYS